MNRISPGLRTSYALILPLLLLNFIAPAVLAQSGQKQASVDYFPPAGEWQHKSPSSMGLDSLKIQEAIRFAREKETKAPRNMELAQIESFGKEPFSDGIGPFADRGEPTGIIVYKGYIV